MSDAMYPAGKGLMMTKQIDLVNDLVKCVLVGTLNYTFSAAHAWLADIPLAARIATSGTITGRTVTLNVFDADDVGFGAVTGLIANAAVIYSDTGSQATSPLIAYLDQAASGLPLTPNGSVVTVTWSNGASKIFAL